MTDTKEKNKYYEAVGRRKTAVARVRIKKATKNSFSINNKTLEEYFPVSELQAVSLDALVKSGLKFSVSALIQGGGISAQADALRHGISRAILLVDEELKGKLKKAGFLKRDPRMKERKKPGLKKARKAAQWSKR
jgi:small subunit ribosomal protein S9